VIHSILPRRWYYVSNSFCFLVSTLCSGLRNSLSFPDEDTDFFTSHSTGKGGGKKRRGHAEVDLKAIKRAAVTARTNLSQTQSSPARHSNNADLLIQHDSQQRQPQQALPQQEQSLTSPVVASNVLSKSLADNVPSTPPRSAARLTMTPVISRPFQSPSSSFTHPPISNGHDTRHNRHSLLASPPRPTGISLFNIVSMIDG
jgi:hypothetical protein